MYVIYIKIMDWNIFLFFILFASAIEYNEIKENWINWFKYKNSSVNYVFIFFCFIITVAIVQSHKSLQTVKWTYLYYYNLEDKNLEVSDVFNSKILSTNPDHQEIPKSLAYVIHSDIMRSVN